MRGQVTVKASEEEAKYIFIFWNVTLSSPNMIKIHPIANGVARLTLNSPENRNALSGSMMQALTDALVQSSNEPSTRVIIIAGEGPAFCAGHDLKEITTARQAADKGLSFFETLMDNCSKLMQTIVHLPIPVIAEIDGVATAAGCQLVASCDLAYASEQSRFATPGVNIGLFCSTPMVALSRNVSKKHAMEMLLTGDMISAERACEIGLINRVLSSDELSRTVQAQAEKIASKSGHVLKTGKTAFYEQAQMNLSEAYEYTSAVMVQNMLDDDAREGIGAFLEKRKPDWKR